MLLTFLVFGAALLGDGLERLDAATAVYAVLSLTVVRMLPVAISLMGSGLRLPSVLFLGWFGPRGLASILFSLLILEQAQLLHRNELLSVTVTTVALSALLHGLSAAPLARLYGRHVAEAGECEEKMPVTELPLRERLKIKA
jgi:NhaP-type Na+/H+ or K+/H+ antiporter